AQLAVSLLEVVQALADHGGVEPVTVSHGKGGAQRLYVADGLVAAEGDGAQPIAVTFFNRHQDVDSLALVGAKGKPVQSTLVANLRLGLFDCGRVVALVAISLPDPLR